MIDFEQKITRVISVEKTGNLVDVSILSHSVDVEYKVQEIEVKLTGTMGPQGIQGESWQEQFETVSKNLKSWNASFNYVSGNLSSIIYTDGIDTIIKTFNYTGSNLTSIILSGNTPSGVSLTKTFAYSGSNITSITYS